jgi:hypothetical protein
MYTDKNYKASYNRGWRADRGPGNNDLQALDEADARGEPNSWYEGYEDSAAHRKKWHSLECSQCDCPS